MKAIEHRVSSRAVWDVFHGRLRSFVSQRVKNAADAEDVVQQIFIRIHEHLPSLKDDSRLAAWIFRIARNAIADYFRGNGRRVEPLSDGLDVACSGPEASALMELSDCLQPLIEGLPRSYRDAIRQTELNGLTQHEAAYRTGISLSGMKTRVQRGRRKLRKLLLACCDITTDARGGVVSYEPRNGRCSPYSSRAEGPACCLQRRSDNEAADDRVRCPDGSVAGR
ncbi:RNA polymerase sigma factor SigZ [Dongia deserti]|uniref:RNA polymerase sigma factor SigZ n=1 Tax=Dongia deserti TaxID=2268030 RepID=UPI0013C484BD|nr:RNA polymerase sigma factor SigZ [Dongia deserti]